MAFEKIAFAMKTWKDKVSGNTPITAAELNRIEKGISDTAKGVNDLGDSVSPTRIESVVKSAQDNFEMNAVTAFRSGNIVSVCADVICKKATGSFDPVVVLSKLPGAASGQVWCTLATESGGYMRIYVTFDGELKIACPNTHRCFMYVMYVCL